MGSKYNILYDICIRRATSLSVFRCRICVSSSESKVVMLCLINLYNKLYKVWITGLDWENYVDCGEKRDINVCKFA